MKINPLNILNLLLAYFQTLQIPESETNFKEIELAEKMKQILVDAAYEFNDIDMISEETLGFHEEYKDCDAQIVEDEIQHHFPNPEFAPTNECTNDVEDISFEYKQRAVEFWRSGKKGNLKIETVQNRFKKVLSKSQLKRWAKTINQRGTYREKIAQICQYTFDNLKAAIESGSIVHDRDLRRWALQAQKELDFEDVRFKASPSWLLKFKKAHRIVSRKVNKFVTKKTLESGLELQTKADAFVTDVKLCIPQIGIANIYNSDQSSFQLEMHSGRTLAVEGEKQVQCLVQSIGSTTHSYTIQPTISATGKLLSPLFLVLKEKSGQFGPVVESSLFRPKNVHVEASKSGKLTTDHFKVWLREVFYPNVGSQSLLLLDAWSGHCDKVIEETMPQNKIVNIKKIPTGTTGKVQPLDVYGFRVWKNFVRHFSDHVILMNYDLNLHLRNNIIKLQSLVHNQLSSPRYTNIFKYSWYKSGYLNEKPDETDNPVDFSFGNSCNVKCEVEGCNNVAIIRCGWCKKSFCFKHFFDDYHFCERFVQ